MTALKTNSNSSSVIKMSNQTIQELRVTAKERGLRGYCKLGKAELVSLLENSAMRRAAREGHIDLVKLCKERGATDFDGAMWRAAYRGHIDIAKLCEEWGAKFVARFILHAACIGNIELANLCEEWGAKFVVRFILHADRENVVVFVFKQHLLSVDCFAVEKTSLIVFKA